MEAWAILEFAFVLVVAIGCFALIIGEQHTIERLETQEWLEQMKKRIRTS